MLSDHAFPIRRCQVPAAAILCSAFLLIAVCMSAVALAAESRRVIHSFNGKNISLYDRNAQLVGTAPPDELPKPPVPVIAEEVKLGLIGFSRNGDIIFVRATQATLVIDVCPDGKPPTYKPGLAKPGAGMGGGEHECPE